MTWYIAIEATQIGDERLRECGGGGDMHVAIEMFH